MMTILLFSTLLFAVLYPLCFWITYPDPIITGFRRFNLGLSNFTGGLAVLGLLSFELPKPIKTLALVWIGVSFLSSFLMWNKKNINPHLLTLSSLIGIFIIAKLHVFFSGLPGITVWSSLLGGGILAMVVYATVLGHWYLNITELPRKHLESVVNVFWLLVFLRFLFDFFLILTVKTNYLGDQMSLFSFMCHLDGFFLWIAILFGTLFPLIGNYFVAGTLRVKNTQSATGILYAILLAIFMGELIYKHYLLEFGIAL